MDINQLTAFIAVAETGSFSLAAERLYLTQPAVSKRIVMLESLTGSSLFDRIGKKVILTEAGQILLPRARKIIREIEDTRIAIRNLSGSVAGRLSLGSSHHVGLHRLPPVLKEYSGLYPGVEIDIAFLDSEKAYEKVRHGEIELAVVTLALEQSEKIYSYSIWHDELAVMISPDHPLAKYQQVKAVDLLDYPAILPAESTFTRQLIDRMFVERQLRLEVGMSTNYLETIKMMVSVGMAWSVLPMTMLDSSLQILKVENIRLERQLGYIYHRSHTLSNAARVFIELLDRYAGGGGDVAGEG